MFSVLLCVNAWADEKVSNSLAIEYLEVSKIKDVIDASIIQYEAQLFVNSKPEEKALFHEIMVGTLGWDATKDQLVDIVTSLYTKEEIEASIAFMTSPVGASATAKSEEFSTQFANMVSENIQKVMAQCCTGKN